MADLTQITPYRTDENKKNQVKKMFDHIAPTYDLLNRFLSLGIDIRWRKKSLEMLREFNCKSIIDIATGTGDFAIMAKNILQTKVTGLDLSPQMLEIARTKSGAQDIEFIEGDSENLHFPPGSFDGATVAFGVRNFENLQEGLKEIYRVLKPNSPLMILEFSKIETFPLKQLFYMYSRYIMPLIGKIVSKDTNAYSYLHESVQAFPSGIDFANQLKLAGFTFIKLKKFSLGICTAYLAQK